MEDLQNKPLVLIMDDEDDFAEIIGTKLHSIGIPTVHQKMPEGLMDTVIKEKPALILMDINMPGIQGPDLVLDLKQNDVTKNISIIFLTNSKEPWPGMHGSQIDVAKEIGAADFIQKTDDLESIVTRIKALLPTTS